MHRPAALVMAMLLACGAPPTPVRSTVTVEHNEHVTLRIDGPATDQVWACSNACHSLGCAANCPTAVRLPGACASAGDASVMCRTFVMQESYERAGSCADADGRAVHRVSCVEHATGGHQGSSAANVFLAILVVPLMLVVIIAAAGQRT